MYIRKAKNEDDYNEEGGVEERQETYQKPHYWAESQKVESEVDNRGNFPFLLLFYLLCYEFFSFLLFYYCGLFLDSFIIIILLLLGKYSSYPPKRGKRGGRFSRGGGYKRFNEGVPSKPAAGNRVRLNSDNFPPLISENDKEKHSRTFIFFWLDSLKFKY